LAKALGILPLGYQVPQLVEVFLMSRRRRKQEPCGTPSTGIAERMFSLLPTPRRNVAGGCNCQLYFVYGKSANRAYFGTAYIFDPHCGRFPYQVQGPILDAYQRVLLQGEALRIGPHVAKDESECRMIEE
jgi:hypothetical protein